MEVIINGMKFIGREPSGYKLIKFTEKYLDGDNGVKEGISQADMMIDLISMVFDKEPEEVKEYKWSVLKELNDAASKVLEEAFGGIDEKK